MGFIKKFIKDTDSLLFWLCIAVTAFGVLLVHSATLRTLEEGQTISRDVIVMLASFALGLILCLAVSWFDYASILKLWLIPAGVSMALMALLFFFGEGPAERSDVKTWLPIPIGSFSMFFQPSELLKVAFIITLSLHLNYIGQDINRIKHVILLCVHGAVPTLLVLITGDMGSAIVFILIFAVMLFLAGLSWKYFLAAGVMTVAALPLVWVKVFNAIQRDRFLALLYPDNYPDIIYQQRQGRYALANGGLTGTGLFKGMYIQNGMVPEAKNDMVLCVAGEELGFIGSLLLLGAFLLMLLRIIHTASRSADRQGKLLCWGVAAMIGSQVVINVGMCLMLLPVIGITLPLVSAGGSSTLCVYLAMGLVFSVYRYNRQRKPVDFRLINVRTPYIDS